MPDQAGTHNVRAGRCGARYRAGGICSRRRQAAARYTLRGTPGRGDGLMKAADVRAKTVDELVEQLDNLGREIFNLRFQRANGQLENTTRVRQVRRDVARIKTVLGERRRTTVGRTT